MKSLPFLLLCAVLGLAIGLGWQYLSRSAFERPAAGTPGAGTLLSGTPVASALDLGTLTGGTQAAGTAGKLSALSNTDTQSDTASTLPALDRPTYSRHSYHDGIKRVAPSVVSVFARGDNNSGNQGSGVIVDTDGVVLTNLHIIEGSAAITVVLSNGEQHAAQVIGSDRETDLAVVQIPRTGLPALRLDEAPPLRVGDIVLAIGNPFGVGQTVTQGIVSATRRRVAGGSAWQNFVQIDAAINPGNSGGALINPDGQLVGVNTAVFRGGRRNGASTDAATGIGFSIPADLLAQVVPQIIEHGHVARGWLGIGVEDLTMYPSLNLKDKRGAVITSVLAGSPAHIGGLRAMDIVTQLGEQPVESATELLIMVSALPPGATTRIVINRGDQEEISLKMRLGERPAVDYQASE